MAQERPAADRTGPVRSPQLVAAASLWCDNCGRVTTRRVLRWDRSSFRSRSVGSGIARCRECQWTHPFDVRAPEEAEVDLILSRGSVSSREKIRLPGSLELVVGEDLAAAPAPLRLRRIDLRGGGSAPRALAAAVASVWASPRRSPSVPVSILEGGRTRPARWTPGPEVAVEVGETVEVKGIPLRVVALRIGGRTYRRTGDRFRAREVERLYGRRTVSPPEGKADWSQDRGRPSSRTRSFSRSARSRSGPGERRARTVPRARIAAAGATVQSVSPS